MITILLQLLLIFTIFFPIVYLVNLWVNQKDYPEWLNYKPFNCRICCTFWVLLAIYIVMGLAFHFWWTSIGGIILTALNAIAMKVNEKNKTISLEDYDNIK